METTETTETTTIGNNPIVWFEISAAAARQLEVLCRETKRRQTMPILTTIRLRADSAGQWCATSSDLDHWKELWSIAPTINYSWIADQCIDRDILRSIVKGAKAPIVIEIGEGWIRAGGRTLPTVSGEEYPEAPSCWPEGTNIRWRSSAGIGLIQTAADLTRSASKDETRYNINTVCWQAPGGAERLISTDGHRLSIAEIGTELVRFDGADSVREILIPAQAIASANRILKAFGAYKSGDGFTDLFRSEPSSPGHVVLWARNADFSLYSRQIIREIHGDFPDYKQVLPKGRSSDRRTVLTADLRSAVSAGLSVMAGDEHPIGALEFKDGDRLVVSARSAGLGSAENTIRTGGTAKPIKFGINFNYLIDAIDLFEAFGQVEIGIRYDGNLGPIEIFGARGDCILSHVLMPVRLA